MKLNKLFLCTAGTMTTIIPIITIVSCGATYTMDQFDSSKSTISQKDFDEKIKELKNEKRNKFTVTFVNSKNNKKTFTITKENADIMEGKIKDFLNVFKDNILDFNNNDKVKLDSITPQNIKDNDGITEITTIVAPVGRSKFYTLSGRIELQQAAILKKIKNYFETDLKITGWNIKFKKEGLNPIYNINEEKGIVSYTVQAIKKGYESKEYKIKYTNFYKYADYEIFLVKKIEGFKAFLEDWLLFSEPTEDLTKKSYDIAFNSALQMYMWDITNINYLKIIDDPKQPQIIGKKIQHNFYFMNTITKKIVGKLVKIDYDQ